MNALGHVVMRTDSLAPELVREHFPTLTRVRLFEVELWQWLALGIAFILAVGVGFGLSRLTVVLPRVISHRRVAPWALALGKAVQAPLTALLALASFTWAVGFIDLTGHLSASVARAAEQLAVAGLAWLAIRSAGSLTEALEQRLLGQDEYRSRGARTQLLVAHRAFSVAVLVTAAAVVLSTYRAVRNVGVSLLASAGIASVVIGIAAQKTLGSLLAGIQLSITQPIRLGDSVVFDGEFATVEEIRLTYVILRIWDLRRLVVPVQKFLDQSFQNWTRVRTPLLGTVELWVDYNTPLGPLREELARLCAASQLWNRQASGLQVTDASDKAMKLRLLVSADTSGSLFDLRCEIREGMIAFLQRLGGGIHLPFSRNANMPDAWDRSSSS